MESLKNKTPKYGTFAPPGTRESGCRPDALCCAICRLQPEVESEDEAEKVDFLEGKTTEQLDLLEVDICVT